MSAETERSECPDCLDQGVIAFIDFIGGVSEVPCSNPIHDVAPEPARKAEGYFKRGVPYEIRMTVYDMRRWVARRIKSGGDWLYEKVWP